MSNPARSAREAAVANGFAEDIAKYKNGITFGKPGTKQRCFESQVGQIYHYGPTLEEADSAWVADADNNYLKMVKADFNLRARKLFNGGDLLKWTDPVTGQYVTLHPNNLSWIDNVSGSQQFIASPAAIASPSVADDVLLWQNGYGTGRHFKYIASTTRLTKHLVIDGPNWYTNLPAPTVANPYLELAFQMTPSSGVSLIVDGSAWDKKTTKSTVNAIEFRTSAGITLWSFSAPTAHDSADSETAGIMQLRKQGGNLIVAVRFPKSWIDAAQFPIVLDPSIDYQVGASTDDGLWSDDAPAYVYNGTGYTYGVFSDGKTYSCWMRWPSVTIPDGATITAAVVSCKAVLNYGSILDGTHLHFNDSGSPTYPTSAANANAKTLTTAYVKPNTAASNWFDQPDISDIITELLASYSYASGAAMMCMIIGVTGAANNSCSIYAYDYPGNVSGPKLHIEYTEAAGGDPEGSLIGGKLIRGGLLLHGVLGRS